MGEKMLTMKSEVFGMTSVVSGDLVQLADQILPKAALHNFRTLCECSQISRTVLYEFITD
jgi:hypothetical protein